MRRGVIVLIGCLCLCIPAGASAAVTAAQVATQMQQILVEPHSQLTDAQRAVASQALQLGTVTSSTAGVSSAAPNPGLGPAPVGAVASANRRHRGRAVASAAATSCYGAAGSREWYHIAGGANVSWVESDVDGWCTGPGGQAIVSVYDWHFPHWIQWPYCLTNEATYHGPDGSWVGDHSTWAHGLHTTQIGVTYPWGCGGLKSFEAALRIAYNGYWDTYNDWGF